LVGLVFFVSVALWGSEAIPLIEAKAFLFKEAHKKTIIASQNESDLIPPASLTKILTAIIAIESQKLNSIVTITHESTTVEPTKMGFKAGDKFRLIDLVKATMIESHNDAAMAIAIHLGGSVENFATMMNTKAQNIGMNNSHFTNPCGFDIKDHHTTANDLAVLTDYAIKNYVFNDIAKIEQTTVTEINSHATYQIATHNKLLGHYPFAQGIKTGYTAKAGPCLIARARKGEKDYILILLNAKKSRWEMAQKVFDEAFGLPSQPFIMLGRLQKKQNPHTKSHQLPHDRLVTRGAITLKG
jgi:D-alanyl-D-alanine carboxypeptidase (penicillin-binding protein 5/6)